MKFQIGDEVEVIDGIHYAITTAGSWGVVEKVDRGYYKIKFEFIPNRHIVGYTANVFIIEEKHLKLRGERASPYFRVINKIKQMDERRAQLGYRW